MLSASAAGLRRSFYTRALTHIPLAALRSAYVPAVPARLSPSTSSVVAISSVPIRSLMSSSAAAAPAAAASTPSTEGGPMQQRITSKLHSTFQPLYLTVMNESYMHSVPAHSETHFKVTVVSEKFEGMGLLARHRAVNSCLAEELAGGVHALSITARTPAQWEENSDVGKSPGCMGGSKHDPAMKK